jgi:hypothetical protein
MLYYLEKNLEESKKNSSGKDLKKFRELVSNMQNQIISKKYERYSFDFIKNHELTATKKESENGKNVLESGVNSENEVNGGGEIKSFPANSGKVVNKYKEKLQALLGKKSLRTVSVK